MKYFTFLIFLISTNCFSQKQYKFDYLIDYDQIINKDTVKIGFIYYLTNSKDNSYTASVTELDSLHFNLKLRDYTKELYSIVKILKRDFFMAEFINFDCKLFFKYKSIIHTNSYDFFILKDTIINKKTYKYYKLNNIKPKIVKRKKTGTNYYIINQSTNFHLPILTYPTAYQEWKLNKNIPNGIFLEKYFVNYWGEIGYHLKLKGIHNVDMKIVISKGCD